MRKFWRGTKGLLFLSAVLIVVEILYRVLFRRPPTESAETLVGIAAILLAFIIAAAFNYLRFGWKKQDSREGRGHE